MATLVKRMVVYHKDCRLPSARRDLNPPPATRVVLFWLSQPPRLTDLGLMKRRYRFGLCESAADAQPLSRASGSDENES